MRTRTRWPAPAAPDFSFRLVYWVTSVDRCRHSDGGFIISHEPVPSRSPIGGRQPFPLVPSSGISWACLARPVSIAALQRWDRFLSPAWLWPHERSLLPLKARESFIHAANRILCTWSLPPALRPLSPLVRLQGRPLDHSGSFTGRPRPHHL
jgi:hypothetical protein